MDGIVAGQYQPPSGSWSTYQTPAFNLLTGGNHTIALAGVGSGTDYTAFVDAITLAASP